MKFESMAWIYALGEKIKPVHLFWFFSLVGTMIFLRSLSFQYVWDDVFLIPAITKAIYTGDIWKIFYEPSTTALGMDSGRTYRPLGVLSMVPDLLFGRSSPGLSHAVNVSLHLFNAFLGFLFLSRLWRNKWGAALVATLWFVHPITVEATCWISARGTLLLHTFLLLALLYLWRFEQSRKTRDYVLSCLFIVLCFGAKEMAVVFCALIPIYLYVIFRNRLGFVIKTSFPFFILGLGFLFLFMSVMSNADTPHTSSIPPWRGSLLAESWSLSLHALYRLIFPWQLAAEYPPSLQQLLPTSLAWKLSLSFLTLWIVWGFTRLCQRRSFYAVGISFFFLPLLPIFLYINQLDGLSDRYLYTSSFGLFACLGYLLQQTSISRNFSIAAPLYLALFFCLSLLTYKHMDVWKNDLKLFENMIANHADSRTGHVGLGVVYAEKGNFKLAERHFQTVLKSRPANIQSLTSLAQTSAQQGKEKEAYLYLARAQKIVDPTNLYGETCAKINLQFKKYDAATRCANELMASSPNRSTGRSLYATILFETGKLEKAQKDLKKILQDNPFDQDASWTYVRLLNQKKDYSGGAKLLNRLQAYQPSAMLFNDLALFQYLAGDKTAALKTLKKALDKYPDNRRLKANYKMIRGPMGRGVVE